MLTTRLQARVLTDYNDLAALERDWSDLFRRCLKKTTFQRPEWILAWMQSFCPSNPLVITLWSESRLVGLAPLLIYSRGKDSVLAFMGGGISDYLDVLIDPEVADQGVASIVEAARCRSGLSSWNEIELTDVPEHSLLLNRSIGAEFIVEPHDCSMVLDLPSSIHDLSSVVPSHKLRNYRNAMRRVSEYGRFEMEVATGQQLEEALPELFRLHRERWAATGEEGVLHGSMVQQFHHSLVSRAVQSGLLRLYVLRANRKSIACLYAFFEADVVYCYLQGFDPEYRKLSPGTIVLGRVIEDAVRHRAKRIDFLRGREAYKYAWGAREVMSYRIRLAQ